MKCALPAAWCYAENYLPFFAEQGYEVHAVSFLGQGASAVVPDAKVAGKSSFLHFTTLYCFLFGISSSSSSYCFIIV
jgi:hypothetical protein